MGSPRTVRVLKEMLQSHKPDFLFLSETLADNNKVALLAPKLGFVNFYSVDKQGRGGGLAIFWSTELNCAVLDASNNHIDVQIRERSGVNWRLTCFMAFQKEKGGKLHGIF